MKRTPHTFSVALAFLMLSGCVSPQALQKRTAAKAGPCLRVGLTIDVADKCMKSAGLLFDRTTWAGVRLYMKSAPGPTIIISESNVFYELTFDDGGQLQSWDSTASVDTM